MNIDISETGPRMLLNDVVKHLNAMGKFPNEYIEFLVEYNGGRPWPEDFDVQGHEEEVFSLNVLFGIHREHECNNLDWNIKNRVDDIPKSLIPIGSTPTGDLLCMDVVEDIGNMYFYDWVGEPGERLYDLEKTFGEFMNSLYEKEYDE